MAVRILTKPKAEPVTVQLAKEHIKAETDVDDELVRRLIKTCREAGELETGRAWVTQTLKMVLPGFPDVIKLDRAPVSSVTEVAYYDASGNRVVLVEGTDYQVSLDPFEPVVAPEPNTSWPSVESGRLEAVEVTYVAGYGKPEDVPARYVQGLLVLLGFLYEDGRSTVIVGTTGQELPRSVSDLWAYDHLQAL